jgi:hypothetical protein
VLFVQFPSNQVLRSCLLVEPVQIATHELPPRPILVYGGAQPSGMRIGTDSVRNFSMLYHRLCFFF